MSDEKVEGLVARESEVFTKEALQAQDGKTVKLTLGFGGPVVGEATLKYVDGEQALKAEFQVDDPKLAEFLKGPPPSISEGE